MGLAPTPSDTESAIVNCANDLLTQGQLAPVVVLCEVDFEELRERELRKLFVGFTRAQYKVVCLMSERAEAMLMGRV